MTLTDILFINTNGIGFLISVTDTSLNIISGKIQGMRTYSSFILRFLNSNIILSNLIFSHFYPSLIYSTFSSMNISNCSFVSSFEKFGDFEVCAMYFEYNVSFIISNSIFDSLRNYLVGSVIFIKFYIFSLKNLKGDIFQRN